MSEPNPKPHPHADADSIPSADHELTPMESFFDNLFNHHMVRPQPTDETASIEGRTRAGETDEGSHMDAA